MVTPSPWRPSELVVILPYLFISCSEHDIFTLLSVCHERKENNSALGPHLSSSADTTVMFLNLTDVQLTREAPSANDAPCLEPLETHSAQSGF